MNRCARVFRFLGRVFLAIGAIFAAGFITLMLYEIFNEDVLTSTTPAPDIGVGTGVGGVTPSVRTSDLLWLVLIVGAMIVGTFVVMGRFNDFMRKTIKKVAGYIHVGIFQTEIALSALFWIIVIAILLIIFPIGGIFASFLFLLNLLFFLLAWLFYGRKPYVL